MFIYLFTWAQLTLSYHEPDDYHSKDQLGDWGAPSPSLKLNIVLKVVCNQSHTNKPWV